MRFKAPVSTSAANPHAPPIRQLNLDPARARGSSQTCSTCDTKPGTGTMSSGPSPMT
jgi:hypothetical protein